MRKANLQTLSNNPLGLLSTTRGVLFSPPESSKAGNIMFNIEVKSPFKVHICENVIVPNFGDEQFPLDVLKQNAQFELESTNYANVYEGA